MDFMVSPVTESIARLKKKILRLRSSHTAQILCVLALSLRSDACSQWMSLNQHKEYSSCPAYKQSMTCGMAVIIFGKWPLEGGYLYQVCLFDDLG